jgi:hypothetical protein
VQGEGKGPPSLSCYCSPPPPRLEAHVQRSTTVREGCPALRRSPKLELLQLLLDLLSAKQESLPKLPAANGALSAGAKPAANGAGGAKAGSRRSSADVGAADAKENGHYAAAELANGAAANGAAANGHAHQVLCADGCIVDKVEVGVHLPGKPSARCAALRCAALGSIS